MVDFKGLVEAKRIERELDTRKIPGEGLNWERILEFAKWQQQVDADFAALFAEPEPPLATFVLNADQQTAWERLQRWVTSNDRYFVLRGYAGTGKTFMMRQLLTLKLDTILFTAPTNKASKVLGRNVDQKSTTIYSALGLKMTAEEDALVLKFSDRPPYIAKGSIIIVDECSMVGRQLFDFIDRAAETNQFKVLYMGDPAQLPPVGEDRSPTWQATKLKQNRAFLKQIMRYDNQLLTLAMRIRECIQEKTYDARLTSDHANGKGVFVGHGFDKRIARYTSPSDWQDRKIIAWRNKTVDRYNRAIRKNCGFKRPYEDGDILLLAEPLELDGVIVASIDEEFTVLNVESTVRNIDHRGSTATIDVWVMAVEGDTKQQLVVPQDSGEFDQILSEKATDARNAPKGFARAAWSDFWNTKRAFHRVRYGYALTAHRSQGSTYKEVYVDQQDILGNDNAREAYRCLYVASTRASDSIFSF